MWCPDPAISGGCGYFSDVIIEGEATGLALEAAEAKDTTEGSEVGGANLLVG